MVKQAIAIDFESSMGKKFRILHIWQTNDYLVVASKLSSQEGITFASNDFMYDETVVEVDRVLPIKHYIVFEPRHKALVEEPVQGPMTIKLSYNYRPIVVSRESDIPASERSHRLYENDFTDTKERVETVVANARNAEERRMSNYHDSCKIETQRNPAVNNNENIAIRVNLLDQVDHNEIEIAMLLSLHAKYLVVSNARNRGDLDDTELAAVSSQLELDKIDVGKLVNLADKYKAEFDNKMQERLFHIASSPAINIQMRQVKHEIASPAKSEQTVDSPKPQSKSSGLGTFGVFAAVVTSAVVAAACVYSTPMPSK